MLYTRQKAWPAHSLAGNNIVSCRLTHENLPIFFFKWVWGKKVLSSVLCLWSYLLTSVVLNSLASSYEPFLTPRDPDLGICRFCHTGQLLALLEARRLSWKWSSSGLGSLQRKFFHTFQIWLIKWNGQTFTARLFGVIFKSSFSASG